jgi:hypothetical protein
MKDFYKEFPQKDGMVLILEGVNGERLPAVYVTPDEATKRRAAWKPPRRIESRRNPKPPSANRPTKPSHPTFLDCIHQFGAIGETTEHKCGGCPGGQFTTVCECELFGKCAPMAWAPVPDKTVRRCVDCGSYSKALPSGAAGE